MFLAGSAASFARAASASPRAASPCDMLALAVRLTRQNEAGFPVQSAREVAAAEPYAPLPISWRPQHFGTERALLWDARS